MQQQQPHDTGLPTSKQVWTSKSSLPDVRGRSHGTLPDQQPGGGLLSGMEHSRHWDLQQQAAQGDDAVQSHWAGNARPIGAKVHHHLPMWERNAAAAWGKGQPCSSKPSSAIVTAGKGKYGVLDVSGPEHADTSHWVTRHKQFALHGCTGGMVDATAAVNSHWASDASKAAGGGDKQQVQQHQELAAELASRMAIDVDPARRQHDNKTTNPAQISTSVPGNATLEGCRPQGGTLWAAAAPGSYRHIEPTVPYIAGKAQRSHRSAFGSPGADAQDDAAAARKGFQPTTGSTSPERGPMSVDNGSNAAPTAGIKRELAVEAEDDVMAEAEDRNAAHGPDGLMAGGLSLQMPHLKKVRTRVEDVRDSSAPSKQVPGSPSPVDSVGEHKPTDAYPSPQIEQTLPSYPDLDCNSAKALGASIRAKPLGLSRFASAGDFPGSPAAPAADAEAAAAHGQKSRLQIGACHSEGGAMASQTNPAASGVALGAAEDAAHDEHTEDPWVKHNKEVQELKQQQEALKALLQQAEQQVKAPLLQEAEHLSKEMRRKAGAEAIEGALATMQDDSTMAKPAIGIYVERLAVHMLAQEGGNWEKAMQRMISMVQDSMQPTDAAGPSSSTRRMSGLHRCSSAASPVPQSGTADDAVDSGPDEVALMQRQHSTKHDLSRQGSSHWGLQRQESVQGNMSPYQLGAHQGKAAAFTSPHSAAASVGPSNSPYQTSAPKAAAAGVAGVSNSPHPAGPVSAVKLAWPMVPASAVGSPVGSPACSPMVPASAVGSPMTAPADAAAAVDDIRSMILPTAVWPNAAAARSPAAAAAAAGSGYVSPVAMAADGCSPCASPVIAGASCVTAAKGRHGSPVCTAGRIKSGTRQPSRMAPKPPRASVASITSGLMGVPGLSISAGGPSAHVTGDAAAMAFASDAAMQAAAAAFAPKTSQPQEQAEVVEVYDGPAIAGNRGSRQQAAVDTASNGRQEGAVGSHQQLPLGPIHQPATTAAAAAAAFCKVPALTVDPEIEDAAGWLSGLLPDTPGPANLLTDQTGIVNNAQPQQAASTGLFRHPSQNQQMPGLPELQQQQHGLEAATEQQQYGLVAATAAALEGGVFVDGANSSGASAEAYAAVEGPWIQARACAPAAHVPGQSWGQGGSAWQCMPPAVHQSAADHVMAPTEASQEQYACQPQLHDMQHSQDVGAQPQCTTAVGTMHADAAAGSELKVLGSDKDDIRMLQVLLGLGDSDA